jgi:hypothetical protein
MSQLNLPGVPPPPDDPAASTIARQPGSVRRTAHINMTWPNGRDGDLELRGRARDLHTRRDGSVEVLDEAAMVIEVGDHRTLTGVTLDPPHANAHLLVGAQGGGGYRKQVDEVLPGEREAGTPLYYLLDDVAGASLIAGFAWSRHQADWMNRDAVQHEERPRPVFTTRICSGLGPGTVSFARVEDDGDMGHHLTPAVEVADPDDPWSWHEIDPAPLVCCRRRRRVDVWRDGDEIVIDAMFRDAVWNPEGVELSLHEYSIEGAVDAESLVVSRITATPRSLPFGDCQFAAPNVSRLVGQHIGDFRRSVIQTLQGADCCTHLNDALRALAEVPVLVARLD